MAKRILVDKKTIKKIASLSRLELTDSELEKFAGEFTDILSFASKIDSVDVSGIKDSHHLDSFEDNVLQVDTPLDKLTSKEKMIRNADQGRSKNGYIVTSKILDN